MNTVNIEPTRAAAPTAAAETAAPRVDFYATIHKALRHFMTDTLVRVGRLDVFDAAELQRTLGQLDALLELCEQHLQTENTFVHTAIDARQPRGSTRTADDHVEHLEAIEALHGEARALRDASVDQRMGIALRLYRHLALFVAENFQHMHFEETHNNALLWQHYTDAELVALHDRILASLPLSEHFVVARWMVPAMSPFERAMVVGGMRGALPAPVFEQILDIVRPHLDDTAWGKLARAIGVPQAPGLVDFA